MINEVWPSLAPSVMSPINVGIAAVGRCRSCDELEPLPPLPEMAAKKASGEREREVGGELSDHGRGTADGSLAAKGANN